MGLLKKVFKSVKKVAKKIGRGIKKIGKKLMGALGKIGPLGQLALMFIGIPPVISNFFGSVGGAIGGFVSRVAPNVAKAFNAIKGVAQGAYNTITEGIGNGIDRVMNFTKGKGFTLSGDRTSIFGGVSAKDITVPDVGDASNILKEGTLELQESTLGDKLTAAVETGGAPQSLSEIAAQTPPPDSLLSPKGLPDVSDITDATLKFDKKSVLDKTKDFVSEQFTEFKETVSDPGKLAGEAVKGGVMSGISSKVAMDIAGEPPTQKVMHSQLSDFMMTPTTPQRLLDATTWNDINGSYQKAGAFGGAATGDLASIYFNQSFADDMQYQQDMKRLGAYSAYTPTISL